MTLSPDSLALPRLFVANLHVVGHDKRRYQITAFLRQIDPHGVICAVREPARVPYMRLGTGELLYFPASDPENPSRFESGLFDAIRGLKQMESYEPHEYDDWLLDSLPVRKGNEQRPRDARLMLVDLRCYYTEKVNEVEAWAQSALKTGRENGMDAYAEELLTYTVRPFNEFFRHMVLALRDGHLQTVIDLCQILKALMAIELDVRHRLNHSVHHVTRHEKRHVRGEALLRHLTMSQRHKLADRLRAALKKIAEITTSWTQPPKATLRTLAQVETELREGSAFVAKNKLKAAMRQLSFLE